MVSQRFSAALRRVRRAMKYLVFCSCGHSLEDHRPEGCGNRTAGPCGCRRDQGGALDDAIERAKIDAVASWRGADEPSDVINA